MIAGIMWVISVLGAVAFAVNLLPQVIKAYRAKSVSGITYPFIYLAYTGNICSCAFVLYSNIVSGFWQYPMYFNYGTALTLTAMLHVMKVKYRN